MTTKVGKLSFVPSKENTLGEGSFGTTVFRGIYIISESLFFGARESIPVAIKRVIKNHAEIAIREVELMQRADDHPNILKYIHTEKNNDFLFIATELCSGTLQEYVEGTYNGPDFKSERDILFQVTQGLDHLHRLKIVHRDIKPNNILIFLPSKSKQPKPQIKLADFGISKNLTTGKEDFTNTSLTTPSGSRGWMPPEVFTDERFDFTVDVWALGCIFAYTLSGGKHPFGDDYLTRLDRIRNKEPMILVQTDLKEPYSKTAEAFELIVPMLEMDPSKRPTVRDVLICSCCFFIPPTQRLQEFLQICDSKMKLKDASVFRTLEKSTKTDIILPLFLKLARDEAVERVLNFNVKLKFGNTPLHILIKYYYEDYNHKINEKSKLIDTVQMMIERGADVNAKNDLDGATPLHYACKIERIYTRNKFDLIRLLIQKGGDVNANSSDESTPLHYLREALFSFEDDHKTFKDMVELLVQNGADITAKNRDGNTPFHNLMHILLMDLEEIARFYIHKGADIDAKNKNGETPLHYLLRLYRPNLKDIVQFFLLEGADVNTKDKNGKTPLHYLCIGSNSKKDNLMDIIQLLIENGADINANDGDGWTPLHFFCKYCDYFLNELNNKKSNFTRLLNGFVEKGTNINAKDKDGKTPLDILRERDENKTDYDPRRMVVNIPDAYTTRPPPSEREFYENNT